MFFLSTFLQKLLLPSEKYSHVFNILNNFIGERFFMRICILPTVPNIVSVQSEEYITFLTNAQIT